MNSLSKSLSHCAKAALASTARNAGVCARMSTFAQCTRATTQMREIDREILAFKDSMNINPARIAYLMRNERLTAMQVEELMELAQKLDCVTPKISSAYDHFNLSRGNSQVERLDSLHEHNLKVMEIMTKTGSDKRMYTILMAAYGLCGNAFRANALLRTMKDARIAPSREIYNLLISINGKEGDLERCTKLFNEMVTFGMEPNVRSWNTLLFLNAREGNIYACAQLYDEMRAQGVAHHKCTYDVLLRIYGKNGYIKTCDKLLLEMENSGVSRDAYTFNLLVEAHAQKGDVAQCARLMEVMRAQGIAPDTQTYTSLIQACAKHEKYTEGIAAYERMRNDRVRANVLTFRGALSCLSSAHAWDACASLIVEMEAQGVEPDARAYEMMLEVCARMGDTHSARTQLEKMKKRGIEIGEKSRMTLTTVFKDSKEIMAIQEEIWKTAKERRKEETEETEDEIEDEDIFDAFQRTIREQMYAQER